MRSLDVSIQSLRRDFADRLDDLGFRPHTGFAQGELVGQVAAASGSRTVVIVLRDEFPYLPPFVRPLDDQPIHSWHLDRTGSLCLYTAADGTTQPWLDTRAFVERIEAWFEQEAAGWPDDPPSLDAERYVERASQCGLTVLFDDLDSLLDHYVKLTRVPDDGGFIRPRNVRRTTDLVRPSHPRGRPPTRTPDRGEHYAWVQDIGEMDLPIRNWQDLRPHLTDADTLEAHVRASKVRFLLLRYHHNGQTGLLALEAATDESDTIRVGDLPATSAAITDLRFRSGTTFATLQTKRVAIIGVGAVGSFTADVLARDGVGHLTLWDSDDLLPGNLVRHLCGPPMIGVNKAEAVAATLIAREPRLRPDGRDTPTNVEATGLYLRLPDQAVSLLDGHDLVIDATANGAATMLLADAARTSGMHCLSVCLLNDGGAARVDVLPPLSGEPLQPTPIEDPGAGSTHFETGCDDPISPTPPDAVLQAAALAARHAVGILVGSPLHGAGEVMELRGPT